MPDIWLSSVYLSTLEEREPYPYLIKGVHTARMFDSIDHPAKAKKKCENARHYRNHVGPRKPYPSRDCGTVQEYMGNPCSKACSLPSASSISVLNSIEQPILQVCQAMEIDCTRQITYLILYNVFHVIQCISCYTTFCVSAIYNQKSDYRNLAVVTHKPWFIATQAFTHQLFSPPCLPLTAQPATKWAVDIENREMICFQKGRPIHINFRTLICFPIGSCAYNLSAQRWIQELANTPCLLWAGSLKRRTKG